MGSHGPWCLQAPEKDCKTVVGGGSGETVCVERLAVDSYGFGEVKQLVQGFRSPAEFPAGRSGK